MSKITDLKQGTKSIKFKLIVAFMSVILVLLLLNFSFLVMHFKIIHDYKEATDNIILENKFTQLIPTFIQSYYNLINSPKSVDRIRSYNALHNEINVTLSRLDAVIISSDSKTKFRALKNIVENLMFKCDEGVARLSNNDIVSAISSYEYVFSKQSLITESTANLMVEELKYTEKLQNNIQNTHSLVLLISISLVCLISICCIFYAAFFSKKIADPLIELSLLTKDVGQNNNLDLIFDKKLLERGDEIGILSKSFNSMIIELKNKMDAITKKDNLLLDVNRQLEEVNQKLKEMDIKKEEFISIAAHELKTPLTSIKGFSQLLKNRKISINKNKRDHYLAMIDENSDRLYRLILDIVDSSRMALGQLKTEKHEVDVNEVFKEIKTDMEMIIKNKNLKSVFTAEKNLPKITADKERLMQVLRNLITNAVKFTDKGTVTLKVYKSGNFVLFEVSDTGKGIPKESQVSIFSKFYQVDGSFTRQFGGSGLGLSICKGLVEAMQGKIWFESIEGVGSTFYFTLPIAKK